MIATIECRAWVLCRHRHCLSEECERLIQGGSDHYLPSLNSDVIYFQFTAVLQDGKMSPWHRFWFGVCESLEATISYNDQHQVQPGVQLPGCDASRWVLRLDVALRHQLVQEGPSQDLKLVNYCCNLFFSPPYLPQVGCMDCLGPKVDEQKVCRWYVGGGGIWHNSWTRRSYGELWIWACCGWWELRIHEDLRY